jgi:tetratricopeptide (TPR) repeat protein
MQVGAMHGDIRVHAGGTLRLPPPRQLPPLAPTFANRHDELSLFDDLVYRRFGTAPMVMVLTGLAGVGKTALAVAALSRCAERLSDGQLYVDLADPAEIPVGDVLGRLLRGLGVAPDQIPDTEPERTALWRSVTAHRRLGLLLEAPTSAQQVRSLLPASPHSIVIVTAQRPLSGLVADGAQLVSIKSLDRAASLELLRQHLGTPRITAEHDLAHEMGELCAGLPLALTVAAAQAVARPQRSLAHVVTALRDAHIRLETLSMDTDCSPEASFNVAYQGLDDRTAQAYRTLGLSPGSEFCLELVAAAISTDLGTALRRIEELVDASLLIDLDGRYYQFHTLVHEHARGAAGIYDSLAVRTEALRRMLRWYLIAARAAAKTVLPARRELPCDYAAEPPYVVPPEVDDHATALGWLDRERRNLGAAVREAAKQGWFDLAILLADAMQPGVIIHKDYAYTVEIDEIALEAAQHTADPAAANSIRKRLARAYTRLGDLNRAQRYVYRSLWETHNSNDQSQYASALKSYALVSLAAGHIDLATALLRRVVAILAGTGPSRSEALALISLADTLIDDNAPNEAIGHLTRAQTLLSTGDTVDLFNVSRAEISLARAHLHTGRVELAETIATQALETMYNLDSRREQARAHDVLAELAERTGDLQRARHHHASAATLNDPTKGHGDDA